MDNRFLYRGKKIFDGEWLYGNHRYIKKLNVHQIIPITEEWRRFDVDPSTIGQCTGLYAAKSYRGTELEDLLIFEGDVVKWCDELYITKRGKSGAYYGERVKCNEIPLEEDISYIFGFSEDAIEIIGNIHDT